MNVRSQGTAVTLSASARGQLVQGLYRDRESDRGINITFGDIEAGAIGDQCLPISNRKLNPSIFTVGFRSTKPARGFDATSMIAVAIVIAAAMTHSVLAADGGNHAVQRKDDVEQHDLRDHAGKACPPTSRLPLLPVVFQSVMDLSRAFVEQEEAACDQHDMISRQETGWPKGRT